MRLYTFGNMYLSQIQQGIQTAHVVAELSVKYPDPNSDYADWAEDHKTIIVLNGGMEIDLWDIADFFDQDENQYNWTYFKESEDALNKTLTCVGIILPEEVYEAAADVRGEEPNSQSSWEEELYQVLNGCRLA